MKIAIFTDCYLDLTGGIVTVINADKAELERRGHTVYVFSSAYKKSEAEEEELARQNIFPVPSWRVFLQGVTPVAKNPDIIEKYLLDNFPEIRGFDVFYVHYEASCSIAGVRLGRKLHIPVVQVMHGREDVGEENIIPAPFKGLVARVLDTAHGAYLPHKTRISTDDYLVKTPARARMWELMVAEADAADLVLTPSEHFAKKLRHYGVKKTVVALPNALSDEIFREDLAPKRYETRRVLKMIWHSRASGEKRLLPFLEALTMVMGPYHLDVYGDGADLKKAIKYAKTHKLKVDFHGVESFKHVYNAILRADLDILVSYDFDTFGMTLIEAGSLGVPSLIVDPDLAEVVPEGGYLLSKTPAPADMAGAINSLFSHPGKIEEMSLILLKNREKTKVSHRIDKLEEIFRSLKKA